MTLPDQLATIWDLALGRALIALCLVLALVCLALWRCWGEAERHAAWLQRKRAEERALRRHLSTSAGPVIDLRQRSGER